MVGPQLDVQAMASSNCKQRLLLLWCSSFRVHHSRWVHVDVTVVAAAARVTAPYMLDFGPPLLEAWYSQSFATIFRRPTWLVHSRWWSRQRAVLWPAARNRFGLMA
jgi:hypothetical protein